MFTYYMYKNTENLYDGVKFYNVIKIGGLFHENYFERHKFKKVYGKPVTYSNDQRLSIIKNFHKDIKEYTLKANLYENLIGKPYLPDFINFSTEEDGWYEKYVRNYIPYDNSIWYLKKASDITYGGYDVFPIKTSKMFFYKKLVEAIGMSNSSKKYISSTFSLQKGISDVYLTPDKKKFDFRCYGLLVWMNGKMEFYYYNTMLLRKNPNVYDKNSQDRAIQLTNTTFNSNTHDLASLTELIKPEHQYWKKFFVKTKKIYEDVCRNMRSNPLFNISEDDIGYHLIGLDFIPDVEQKIHLLEINKYPAIHSDERIDSSHKGMERTMFSNENFYSITFDAFRNGKHVLLDTPDFYHCKV